MGLFDFIRTKGEDAAPDVKTIRDGLLQFIKEQLQRAEGGEGSALRGIYLYLAPAEEDKHLYEAAIYTGEEERLREEVQRIADDFALTLPEEWKLETSFAGQLPGEAIKAAGLPAGLIISTRRQPVLQKEATAYLQVLNGEAEAEWYTLSSTVRCLNIGREKKVQTADGFFRINQVAFAGESQDPANQYISRQHAHIGWDGETGTFLLFADEGGIPPRNKVKVRRADGEPVKLQSAGIGHVLEEGDQIILGESALLLFTYSKGEV
ncbi:MAG TPA: FHA domain-containing protein [Chitinophagaceae bacterium]|nr:FHA domain-containing protein [Chitinophagaceae bacterium]